MTDARCDMCKSVGAAYCDDCAPQVMPPVPAPCAITGPGLVWAMKLRWWVCPECGYREQLRGTPISDVRCPKHYMVAGWRALPVMRPEEAA